MPAWGVGPFENDDALGFARELAADGPVAVEEALDVVLDHEGEYVEAPEGARGLAAAAVV
ncbi:DUF4259 domain-containing protein, partial [Deinococcus pimensis]|uniref:DUF4259 domain-containing protein n=1 Tax=Deinococcus pimensis TaxID=309888 RepID=UPI0012F990F3